MFKMNNKEIIHVVQKLTHPASFFLGYAILLEFFTPVLYSWSSFAHSFVINLHWIIFVLAAATFVGWKLAKILGENHKLQKRILIFFESDYIVFKLSVLIFVMVLLVVMGAYLFEVFIILYALCVLFFNIPKRSSFIAGFFVLLLCSFMLVNGKFEWANRLGIYAYYFLCIGMYSSLKQYVLDRSVEGK